MSVAKLHALIAVAFAAFACNDAIVPPESRIGSILADRFDNSEWSEPENLGPVINSASVDANAGLSPDAHELYFVSNRPGGQGGNDIWVSYRGCLQCPWEAPVNLGTQFNTAAAEGAPTLSEDGRMLFFFSGRPGGQGGLDIWVSERLGTGANGDVWGEPVNLGPDVNTAGAEQGSYYVREGGDGTASLYFNRTVVGLDVFRASLSSHGEPLGPAVAVPELNSAGNDQKVAVRTDGHELLLSSARVGGLGDFDLWRFTRRSVHEPWSEPEHLGGPVSTAFLDGQPNLSRDGRTLILTSNRPGGHGANDLWISTREP